MNNLSGLKKGALLGALCCSILSIAQAQSWEVIQMEPSVLMMDLCVLPDGQHGWTVGSRYAGGISLTSIVETTDGGANWSCMPFPDSTSFRFNGVCFTTPDSGWVVGYSGAIFATTDGGNTWVQQTSGTTRKLNKVCFINSSQGWITGGWNDGSLFPVLKTTDGGATWQDLSFGSECYSCNDIFFYDSLNGWITARKSGAGLLPLIYHTTDGGSSWISQTVPGGGTMQSIDFATVDKGWISCGGGAVLHTTDGGTNWTVQTTNINRIDQYCIDCQDTLKIALASTRYGGSVYVHVSSDGGLTWTTRYVPTSGYTRGIQYVEDNIWVVVDNSKILRSTDNGATWVFEYNSPLLRSFAWGDSLNGWVVYGSSYGYDGAGYRTTDGGITWVPDTSVPGGAQVIFVDDQNGWTLWEGSNASVWRTTDAGSTWNRHFINSGGNWIVDMFFISPDSGWVCGQNGTIRVTSNGGQTWGSQSSGTTDYLQSIYFVNVNEGWAVGANGFIGHTTNGGANWTVQTPAQTDYFTSSYFLNNQEGWLGTLGCRVHKTTDGGSFWQVVGQTSEYNAKKIIMKDSNIGWFATYNAWGGSPPNDGRGFIYQTTNGGSNWNLQWSAPWTSGTISDIAFQSDPSNELLWACGGHNTILRYIPPVSVHETEDESLSNSLCMIVPNPFRSGTAINYTIPQTGRVRVYLYDVLGRKIRTLVDRIQQSGSHIVSWDGKDMFGTTVSKGIYFCRLETESRHVTRKLLLIK